MGICDNVDIYQGVGICDNMDIYHGYHYKGMDIYADVDSCCELIFVLVLHIFQLRESPDNYVIVT